MRNTISKLASGAVLAGTLAGVGLIGGAGSAQAGWGGDFLCEVTIQKTDAESGAALAGAEFQIDYATTNEFYPTGMLDDPGAIDYVQYFADRTDAWAADGTVNTPEEQVAYAVANGRSNSRVMTTDSNGEINLWAVDCIDSPTLTVTELSAPDGYVLDSTPQVVVLNSDQDNSSGQIPYSVTWNGLEIPSDILPQDAIVISNAAEEVVVPETTVPETVPETTVPEVEEVPEVPVTEPEPEVVYTPTTTVPVVEEVLEVPSPDPDPISSSFDDIPIPTIVAGAEQDSSMRTMFIAFASFLGLAGVVSATRRRTEPVIAD